MLGFLLFSFFSFLSFFFFSLFFSFLSFLSLLLGARQNDLRLSLVEKSPDDAQGHNVERLLDGHLVDGLGGNLVAVPLQRKLEHRVVENGVRTGRLLKKDK